MRCAAAPTGVCAHEEIATQQAALAALRQLQQQEPHWLLLPAHHPEQLEAARAACGAELAAAIECATQRAAPGTGGAGAGTSGGGPPPPTTMPPAAPPAAAPLAMPTAFHAAPAPAPLPTIQVARGEGEQGVVEEAQGPGAGQQPGQQPTGGGQQAAAGGPVDGTSAGVERAGAGVMRDGMVAKVRRGAPQQRARARPAPQPGSCLLMPRSHENVRVPPCGLRLAGVVQAGAGAVLPGPRLPERGARARAVRHQRDGGLAGSCCSGCGRALRLVPHTVCAACIARGLQRRKCMPAHYAPTWANRNGQLPPGAVA